MRAVQLETAPAPLAATTGPAPQHLLEIDADAFRADFDRRGFYINHHLSDHPLFALPRLIELARRLPEHNVEYNAGDVPVNLDPTRTPRTGLSPEETIRRIEECRSWMVLKYVENDPEYGELLHRCLHEVRVHSEQRFPGMCQAQGFVFLTSPGSVTPYHMDPEHNFLLQIRGSKTIHQFDGRDRSVLSEEELERFYSGAHRNMVFKPEYENKAQVYELTPGRGLHFPVTAPHWVKNGAAVSISFSITFRTPDLDRRGILYTVNHRLRQRGWRPTPVGQSGWRDALKCAGFRVWRRTRRLLGRPVT